MIGNLCLNRDCLHTVVVIHYVMYFSFIAIIGGTIPVAIIVLAVIVFLGILFIYVICRHNVEVSYFYLDCIALFT